MSCGSSPCSQPLISCVPPPLVVNFAASPGAANYRLDIMAFTGGAINCLDFIPISPYVAGAILEIQIGGPGQPVVTVQKIASTAASVVAAIIRPPDYNSVSNAYQWYVIG